MWNIKVVLKITGTFLLLQVVSTLKKISYGLYNYALLIKKRFEILNQGKRKPRDNEYSQPRKNVENPCQDKEFVLEFYPMHYR